MNIEEMIKTYEAKRQNERDKLILARSKYEQSLSDISAFVNMAKNLDAENAEQAFAGISEESLKPSSIFSSLYIDDLNSVNVDEYEANFSKYREIVDKVASYKQALKERLQVEVERYMNC